MTDQDEPTNDGTDGQDQPPRRVAQAANAYRAHTARRTVVDRMRGNQGRHRHHPPTGPA